METTATSQPVPSDLMCWNLGSTDWSAHEG